jgi:hypothetical protein
MDELQAPIAAPASTLRDIFDRGRYLSIKHDSYFAVYEQLFQRFVGQPVTFVEVGVLNGGSLFMWREYLGPQARIIGVEFNPGAVKWREQGFEIHIGNQADPAFWKSFFEQVGPVDVLLDDGGHTNQQQIVTVASSLPHVRDGGMVVVEDTHASYLPEFGNPSRRSFVRWSQRVMDSVASRSGFLTPARNGWWRTIHAVEVHESIHVFHIDRRRCAPSRLVYNRGESSQAADMRLDADHPLVAAIDRKLSFLNRIILLKSVKKRFIRLLHRLAAQRDAASLATYFD